MPEDYHIEFRKGSATVDAIRILRQIMKKSRVQARYTPYIYRF